MTGPADAGRSAEWGWARPRPRARPRLGGGLGFSIRLRLGLRLGGGFRLGLVSSLGLRHDLRFGGSLSLWLHLGVGDDLALGDDLGGHGGVELHLRVVTTVLTPFALTLTDRMDSGASGEVWSVGLIPAAATLSTMSSPDTTFPKIVYPPPSVGKVVSL